MKIEITSVATSKKGTIWIQAKILEGDTPATNVVFDCKELEKPVAEVENVSKS